MKKSCICISLLLCINVMAQPAKNMKFQLKGLVLSSETGTPIQSAVVFVIDEKGDTINYTGTSSVGAFLTSTKSAGRYLLKFSAMSYKEDSLFVSVIEGINDIGVVKLSEGRELDAVKVFARKYIMKEEVDRLIYDVTKDTNAHKVKMMDIMKKIPFIKVKGSDGKLKYLSDDIETIYINGRPNEMINGDRQYPMKFIKGDVMKTIEIILPGTKDNPGDIPIININLARDLPNGFVGELNTNASNNVSLGGDADFIVKASKLYFSLNYGIDYLNKQKTENTTEKNFLTAELPIKSQINQSVLWNNNLSHNLLAGVTYAPNKKDIFKIAFSTNLSNGHNFVNSNSESYDLQNNIIFSTTSNSTNRNSSTPKLNGIFSYNRKLDDNNGQLTFNMNLTNSLSVSDYILANNINTNDYSEINSLDSTSTLNFNATINLRKTVKKVHSFIYLASYTERRYNNYSLLSSYAEDVNNGLNYNQKILSASVNYSLKLKKFSFKSVIALENNTNKGNFINNGIISKLDYNEFAIFPSINIVYNIPRKIRFGVSYIGRPFRPSVNYLNPFIDNSDPKNLFKGNPYLKSNYVHMFSAKASKRIGNNLDIGLVYSNSYTNNAIEYISTIDNTGISTSTYENIGKKFIQKISGNLSFFKNWLWIVCSGGYNVSNYVNNESGERNEARGFNFTFNGTFDISNSTVLEISYNLIPSNSAQMKKTTYYSSTSLNLSQTIIKDKLFMNLFINDPLRNHKYKSKIIGNDEYTMTTRNEQLGRIVGISLRWNFGHLKDQTGKIIQPGTPDDLKVPEI